MLTFSDTNMMDPSDRQGLVDDIEAFINERFRRTRDEAHRDRPDDGPADRERATDDGQPES